ncbi:MAG: hypothetical protein WCQ97_00605 [Aminobacterium sp.]|jgi:hypothetical protein|uniref:Uncharacterized protein n=1 Tax=bioreactor metagenome TaxID=1076179 RepID=A0A645AMP9_9ZZZZ|nr:hypothetical protein [Aminobacterium sp.]MDD2206228.1 hypothetical protein [Aminobacterium sp.]MDD3426947.1 hypothetical protein [Aminobacterium sp.]MDD3707666.1 hypothetical protein [Aminobacterium sp.]MDD4227928.1 hypothetical protein [Aminobacterium sp.]MDD4552472.1 hypothetical protein [Aminobacterium sp.]
MKKMLKLFVTVMILTALCLGVSNTALFAQSDEGTSTFQTLNHVEDILYGRIKTGGLIERLSNIEKDLFGRELPGSIAERQTAILDFLEKGTSGQPSMLFKLGVAEWAINQRVDAYNPVNRRVDALETVLEGTAKPDKPIAMRLERILGLILSDAVQWQDSEIPAGQVFKVKFKNTLSPSTAKKGDSVDLELSEDLVSGNTLLAPAGCRVVAHIDSVTKPRSFGRPAEVNVGVDQLLPLGPEVIPVTIGEQAKKASKAESSQIAAAGTSFIGAILFGPVGLAGGFLVRGDAKEIPAGTELFIETAQAVRISAYPVPAGLQGMVRSNEISGEPESGGVAPVDEPNTTEATSNETDNTLTPID